MNKSKSIPRMEQGEVNRNKLESLTGKKTRQKLKKLGLSEKKPLRMISADPPFNKTTFGCNEEFISLERDEEIRAAWIEKVGLRRIKL